ncbi:MAG: hypothetical protein NVS9B3_10930 [Gemmatimonadaceae bacterium]
MPTFTLETHFMKRVAFAALAAAVVLTTPGRLLAQQQDTNKLYGQKRAELIRELQQTQSQLAQVRGQRVQLQAKIEEVLAQMLGARAQTLLLSSEQNALQQLDAVLTSSQDNLLQQRDRFTTLGEAVKRRTGAVLVIVLRADSGQAQPLTAASLTVDNGTPEPHTYSTAANGALALGAVDQLYRASVLPTTHTATLTATVNGQQVSQSTTVTAAGESVTYVQFALRNGQLVATTWTAKGTTPF